MLGVLFGKLGKFGIDLSDARLLISGQIGTVLHEVEHRFLNMTLMDSGELRHNIRLTKAFQHLPQIIA